ncbi:hypothetical protein BKA62DRAFT_483760 [Auriculariales sp. MPI-PUGE-AT-0066]|nr:hypothetical protein BKA62DRAFT_483760 [Auriculariales sp. MPI-PUGE-AT-0066]
MAPKAVASKSASSATSSRPKRATAAKSGSKRKPISLDSEGEASDDDDDDVVELDSDHLDSDSDSDAKAGQKRKRVSNAKNDASSAKKRKSTSNGSAKVSPKKSTSASAKKTKKGSDEDFGSDAGSDSGGERIVGRVVQAPTTGKVPPGQVSQNTMNFLRDLKKPECNDREWFRLHEPVYRQAEQEWKDFIIAFSDKLSEIDSEIPPLPPKDVVHRIYRDVRFSHDKTPYKTNFSASFSRTGRKGPFAHCTYLLRPGGGSLIAAGLWQPAKDSLQLVRANIQRRAERFRRVIGAPEFVKMFGEATPHPKGQRRNVYGGEDELKTAPKGIEKTHPDIDLLKLRSFAVVHTYPDAEVLKPGFATKLADAVRVLLPFVHRLNEMSTVPAEDDDEDGDEEDE